MHAIECNAHALSRNRYGHKIWQLREYGFHYSLYAIYNGIHTPILSICKTQSAANKTYNHRRATNNIIKNCTVWWTSYLNNKTPSCSCRQVIRISNLSTFQSQLGSYMSKRIVPLREVFSSHYQYIVQPIFCEYAHALLEPSLMNTVSYNNTQ